MQVNLNIANLADGKPPFGTACGKIIAAEIGHAVRVKSQSSGENSFFLGLREVQRDEFERHCGAELGTYRINQYLNGIPCVWRVVVSRIHADNSAHVIARARLRSGVRITIDGGNIRQAERECGIWFSLRDIIHVIRLVAPETRRVAAKLREALMGNGHYGGNKECFSLPHTSGNRRVWLEFEQSPKNLNAA